MCQNNIIVCPFTMVKEGEDIFHWKFQVTFLNNHEEVLISLLIWSPVCAIYSVEWGLSEVFSSPCLEPQLLVQIPILVPVHQSLLLSMPLPPKLNTSYGM